MQRIPIIDISSFDGGDKARSKIAQQWDQAFRSVGFCSILGHGLSAASSDRLYRAALDFFALPLAEKLPFVNPDAPSEGYFPFRRESVGRSRGDAAPPDLSEAIQFPNLHRGLSVLDAQAPAGMRNLHEAAEAYAIASALLVLKLMHISAIALDLPESYFEHYYDPMTTKCRCALYPDQVEEPLPGQLRSAAHTDFSVFTLLRQDNALGGLQVSVSGEWIDVTPVDGALVVNSGDLLQRWTNDRWKSNLHRVVNPPGSLNGSTKRLSLIVFTGPDPDAEIACLPTCYSADMPAKYPPITAADHVREKVRLTLGLPA